MAKIKIKVIDNTQVFIKAKDEATVAILNAIGEKAAEYAKELVPQPGHSRGYATGALHDSIGYSTDKKAVRIFATQPYASYVELGTSNPNYPKQPYLKPAMQDHQDEYKSMAESIYRSGASDKNFRIVKFDE